MVRLIIILVPFVTIHVGTPGPRLTFMVHQRDGFKCVKCGRSPATHPGTVLEVDHKRPRSRGGLTIYSNLRTLCRKCNLGKGNL